jgi:transcriptional/translational regulatory protein YebC/TACO1
MCVKKNYKIGIDELASLDYDIHTIDYGFRTSWTMINVQVFRVDSKCWEHLQTIDITAVKFQKMIDALEDDDDVQDVYHNAEFPEGFEG